MRHSVFSGKQLLGKAGGAPNGEALHGRLSSLAGYYLTVLAVLDQLTHELFHRPATASDFGASQPTGSTLYQGEHST